jgi:hypothetical protein
VSPCCICIKIFMVRNVRQCWSLIRIILQYDWSALLLQIVLQIFCRPRYECIYQDSEVIIMSTDWIRTQNWCFGVCCILEIRSWYFIFNLKLNYNNSDLLSRYSIMKYEILDGLSGWFRDWSFRVWIIVACVTRCVYFYVSVSDLWTVQVLEIVGMNSCIFWPLSCFVIHTKVNSVLWDLQ